MFTIENPQSGKNQNDKREKIGENEPNSFDFKFYVTDHSSDKSYDFSDEELKQLYQDIEKDGIESIRYDWRWKNIEAGPGKYDLQQIERYGQAKKTMEDVGLEEPTIILSDIPGWALELYKTDKEKFFEAFRGYASKVRDQLESVGGKKISRMQILNELNNPFYTPVKMEDMPKLCQIAKETFGEYNPDIKSMVTVSIGTLPDRFSKSTLGMDNNMFLNELEKIKENFDIIAVDYYPGTWHLPFKEAGWKVKDVFKQLDSLKEVLEKISLWDKEYELGEVGLPTKWPWGGEKTQRYFYNVFFRAFKHLMVDFRKRGVKLPSRVGLYQAIDEPPKTIPKKIAQKLTPFPEHDFGMRKADGSRKLILKGNRHKSADLSGGSVEEKSRLSEIINYMNAPMEAKDEK